MKIDVFELGQLYHCKEYWGDKVQSFMLDYKLETYV